MTLLLPNSQLVARAWLQGITGLPSNAVGMDLPKDATAWADGFIQTLPVGGDRDRDVPVRRPVMQVVCWAANRTGAKPPWGKANQLAEIIACHCDTDGIDAAAPTGRPVTLITGYQAARVQLASVLTEPRPVTNDEARYAGYQFDLLLVWIPVVTP